MGDADEALALFEEAFRNQREGNLDEAVRLYKASIAVAPTAEAHTFLGWTYSWQGKIAEAIDECLIAIEIDPSFGNPYNDIGVYLIAQGELDEAIPWLERATRATRYECPQFPWLNLGRVYMAKEQPSRARDCFREAVEREPSDEVAVQALAEAEAMIN